MMYKPEQRVTSLKSRDILSPVGKWMLTKTPHRLRFGGFLITVLRVA